MMSFSRFIVSASAGTLVAMVSLWANAGQSVDLRFESWADEPAVRERCEAEAESAWFASCGITDAMTDTDPKYQACFDSLDADAAYEDAYRSCEQFESASLEVASAPAFCAATFVERTVSGFRAVCVLEGAL